MPSRYLILSLLFANLLLAIALLVFATGFFPYTPFLSARASFRDQDAVSKDTASPFDKIIFMVVDALRSDFVYSNTSGFKFTQSLIRSGAAIPFTAHATSPTITMPRVKAITTGSTPSFLDVILNFAESDTTSSLADQDTWLSQLNDKPGGKLVMYGDDTWLKLFPNTFFRADGTSSFFVSDFTEVDNNVTRHIPTELKNRDWNGMILHFLGLDHIGHKSGPQSPYMIPKQLEMDAIVQQIYEAIETEEHLRSTILVICGDHGMNDAGNHGGSSDGETSPALVFVSPKLQTITEGLDCPMAAPAARFDYYTSVEQSDIAPTLAGLLGFPIPLNNLGVFIPEFLHFWDHDSKIRLMDQNARQILRIVQDTFPEHLFGNYTAVNGCLQPQSDGELLNCLWKRAISLSKSSQKDDSEIIVALTQFSKHAQSIMSSTASNYNVRRMYMGIGIGFLATLAGCVPAAKGLPSGQMTRLWIPFLFAAYGVMMFASSYIEEEHHFWYWASSAWISWLFIKERSSVQVPSALRPYFAAGLLAIVRIIRAWNQTGQKHAGEPDIARTILPAHSFVLWSLILVTYLAIIRRLAMRAIPWAPRHLSYAASFALGLSALGFKIAFTKADAPEILEGLEFLVPISIRDASLVAQARAFYASNAIVLGLTIFPRSYRRAFQRETTEGILLPLRDLFTLFLVTQSRTTNIPLFLLFELQFQLLTSLPLCGAEITLTSIFFQHLSFFAFGGTNAISSVDLSNAYNGIKGYNVVAVGMLTFCGNWAGPLWWTSATALLLSKCESQQRWRCWIQHISRLTAFAAISVLSVMLACTILKTHLFIWTVFSPKYLYSMAWTMGQHLCINVGFGSLLFWIGRKDIIS